MVLANRVLVWLAVALSLLLAACAGSSEYRILDSSIGAAEYSGFSLSYGSVDEFALASDLVFVGQLVGYEESVLRDGPSPEDPAEVVIEFDGLVFDVVEVLGGRSGLSPDRVVVAQQAVVSARDLPTRRIDTPPLDIVAEGIRSIDSGSKPTFLVFVLEDSSSEESSLYFFNTDGGAVELDDAGIVLPGAGNPWQDFEVLNGELDLSQVRSRVAGAVETVFVPPNPPIEPQDTVVTVPVETTEGTN